MITWLSKFCERTNSKNKENKYAEEDNHIAAEKEKREFRRFHETYKIISFAMVLGLVFPNRKTDMFRVVAILAVMISITPVAVLIFIDIYKCWLRRDFIEIIRHSTVAGPFFGGFVKMFLMFYKRGPCKEIIDEFDRDYASYNTHADDNKTIIRASVKNSLIYSEKCWAVTVFSCVLIFPVMATLLNVYNCVFKSVPTKYMVHELNKPVGEPEDRFDSPYFEIMYAYMLYCTTFYIINFLGYDGYFGLSVNHACLKMTLYCKGLEDAMKVKDRYARYRGIVDVIKDQNRLFRFVDLIQDTFNIWLGIILIATMIQICNVMYHISEGHGFDLRYSIFIVGTVVHIYLPCRYASKLKAMSIQTSDQFYASGWESVPDLNVMRMLVFMIARAQQPIEITAFNMKTFDMELFVSILQTSYSMFTLLRS